ncbi:MAG: hypothetical protein WCW01_02250 [Gammaproteobacteria bacterium]
MELSDLEKQVATLIKRYAELHSENLSLRQKLAQTTQEKHSLLEHKRKIAGKIKQIVTQTRKELST